MDINEEQLGGVTALSVKGRIDSGTAPEFGGKLEAAVSAPMSRLVVDLRELEYISSAGFRVLLVAAKRAEATDSKLVLCSLPAKVQQLFDLGGFLDLFAIVASRDEAIAAAR
jgi:anti-anti-sigma factor